MSDGDGDVDVIPSSPQHVVPATLGSSVIPVTTPLRQTASEIAGETSVGDDVDATPSPYQHDIPATLNSPAFSVTPTTTQRSTTDLTGRTEEMSDGDGDVDAIPSSPQHGDPATLGSSVIPVTTPPQQTASEIAGETSEGDDVDAIPSPYQHDIPATPNSPALSAIPTQDQDIDSDSEDEDVSDNPSSRQEAENGIRERLLRRWRQRFNDCHQQNIDITFEQFSKEVLAAANLILSKPPLERLQRLPRDQHQNPPPTEPTTAPETRPANRRRRRNQTRQQQRARRHRHHNPEEASRIQKMYMRYPKKALRKVLGEEGSSYSGGVDTLRQHIDDVYHRMPPSDDDVNEYRRLYDGCNWQQPTAEEDLTLDSPPTANEIAGRLKRAQNTSPGTDGIEYRHWRAIDRSGNLLCAALRAVHDVGIPASWRKSRVVLIHKKGTTDDPSNFRPINLLPTIYKIYSGILASRLTTTARQHQWLSAEQKGFLPGVRGIQEHTFLLQAAIDNAKKQHSNLCIAWLDLTNAFGSIPHPALVQLFDSLPVPDGLKRRLRDIYTDNKWEFVSDSEPVAAYPVAGVRQGDSLSPIIFNLASEPLVRAAKGGQGVDLFGATIRTTVYADDTAVVAQTPDQLQTTLDDLSRVASSLGMMFNPAKCVSLTFRSGKVCPTTDVQINDGPIRPLQEDEQETYLGTPIGARLLYRPATQLPEKLRRVNDSLLTPWQKLEVLRSQLLPSLSHHLASGKVEKRGLYELDSDLKKLLRNLVRVPDSTTIPIFHAERRVGGLAMPNLVQEADVWTVARGIQILTSDDDAVAQVANSQLNETITSGLGRHLQPGDDIPTNAFLSGDRTGNLYAFRHHSTRMNLWTRTRHAASRLACRLDVSDENPHLLVDDVAAVPAKAVMTLHLALRRRWTRDFTAAPVQGRVARALDLDKHSNDIAQMISVHTKLSFQAWSFWHKSRVNGLAVKGGPGTHADDPSCRRCHSKLETTSHVVSGCPVALPSMLRRHDNIQRQLEDLLRRRRINFTSTERPTREETLVPDILVRGEQHDIIIDVAVPFDEPSNLERSATEKAEKYQHLGAVMPLIVGALGAWPRDNDNIQRAFNIPLPVWAAFRKRARSTAIEESCKIIAAFFGTVPDDP